MTILELVEGLMTLSQAHRNPQVLLLDPHTGARYEVVLETRIAPVPGEGVYCALIPVGLPAPVGG